MAKRLNFLRVKEASELLGVCPNTLRSWGSLGKLPEYRHPLNRYRLYKRADIEKLLCQIELHRTPRRGRV
jgi:DNA-binding transcriptional MerR regulator